MNDIQNLKSTLQDEGFEVLENELLSKHTTWKIGGAAELFVVSKSSAELQKIITHSLQHEVDYTIIGWGSNVLISDDGIKGLVIKNTSQHIEIKGVGDKIELIKEPPTPRLVSLDHEHYYDFNDLDYDESDSENVVINLDSGVYLPYLINTLISQGITGLQWFSGIPGTIGGAIYNNIHGGNHFISEYVISVTALEEDGNIKSYTNEELEFSYDYSVFHNNNDVILTSDFNLFRGDKERARNTSMAWAKRKSLQPSNSAGCSFQNLEPAEQERLNLESNSWGYIIDKILGLKGYKVGGASISTKHAAFIETSPGASSSDVLSILDKVFEESQRKLGIQPKLEVFLLGFDEKILNKYNP